jgi:hypothetical protein
MGFYTGQIPAASNRADLLFAVELTDNETNDTIDLTGALITVALRPPTQPNPLITGTNVSGHVTVTAPGNFDVHFTRDEMAQFLAGEIDMGITLKMADGNTYQIFSGQLPVVDGVVQR